jgi:hypothetical protein
MKIYNYLLFLIVSCVSCFAETNTQSPSFVGEVEFFYFNRSPETAKKIIKKLVELKQVDDCFYFFIALAKEHPKEIVGWLCDSHIKFSQHPRLIHALHLAGLQEKAIELAVKERWSEQKIASLRTKTEPLLHASFNLPGFIPCMCSHFYVSGDVRYIKRMIDILDIAPKQVKNPKELESLQKQAELTLQTLLCQHERVYQFCLKEAKVRKGASQAVLSHLLQELHEAHYRAFPSRNGMLNGIVVTTDEASLRTQSSTSPAMAGASVRQISSIPYPKQKKDLILFVLFNGYELDKDLNAHVTYDLEIIDPLGKKMGDFHDLPALKGKIPSRFLSQRSDQPIMLSFEDADPAGVYKIQATIKDLVGKRELKLNSSLEILAQQ